MALSAFSERFALYDSTPVENLFLLEYMPYAPCDYVRVYLYGLMQCHHPDADSTLEGFARVLNMKPETVLSAFKYWEQKGLVIGLSDREPSFQYLSVRNAMLLEKREEQGGAYQYRDFNNQLQSMLGLLHPQQFKKAMEWVEDLKIPADVVLTMVREKTDQLTEGGAKKRSIPYLFKVFDETAMDFANKNIRTIEQAQKELMRGTPSFKLASKVLDYLNLRRNPTTAEVELCTKWISEWRLGEPAVMAALKQTSASSNPSFAYLDKILERHSAAAAAPAAPGGSTGSASARVETSIERERAVYEGTKKLLTELGVPSHSPSEDQRRMYQTWLDQGFEHEVLLRAAVRCNRSGRRSLDQLELALGKWRELGVTTVAAAEEYGRARDQLRKQAAEVFERAGLDQRPAEADLDQLREWLKAAPIDLVLFAAECARGLKLPTRSISKNLSEWAKKGIQDVESAKRERQSRQPSARAASPATPNAAKPQQHGFKQRSYDDSFFDDFFANLGDEEGKP